jgi:hypothetical protein
MGNSLLDEKSTWELLLARLIKLTASKENFLTECFAAVLQEDKRATVEYWNLVTGGLSERIALAELVKFGRNAE